MHGIDLPVAQTRPPLDDGRTIPDHLLAGHTIVAGMCAEARESHALHIALGFHDVARFEQVGRKFDRWLDVIYTQLLLQPE